MPDPDPGGVPPDAERPGPGNGESLFHRVIRSAIAPDVLEDGGHDAPLSRRGRILFYGVVGVLVIGIVVLLLVTASSHSPR